MGFEKVKSTPRTTFFIQERAKCQTCATKEALSLAAAMGRIIAEFTTVAIITLYSVIL